MAFEHKTALTIVVLLAAGCTQNPDAPITALSGDSNAQAASAIPRIKFIARAEDFADDYPEATGMHLSFNTLHVIFETEVTVGDVNAVLKELDAEIVGGLSGDTDTPGVLQIRIPITNHEELLPIHESLNANPLIRVAVPDLLLTPQYTTEDNDGNPTDWDWDATPSGGNWGHELCRTPQMWNLTEALSKSNRYVKIGILDSDFESHPDIIVHDFVDEDIATVLATANGPLHGMHVAGIAAGVWDDGRGIDGVSPMAQLIQKKFSGSTSFIDIVDAHPDTKVINISVGVGLIQFGLDPESAVVSGIMDAMGQVIATYIEIHGEENLPTIVVAAGNDSQPLAPVSTMLSSPFANAAFNHGAENIIVVENIAQCDTCPGGAIYFPTSSTGGHVSAPGTSILSTFPDDSYGVLSGTSMAAPFVAGLVNYLYALEPTLTHAQVKQLLRENAVALDGQDVQPRVDAWATAMDVDRITGKNDVMRMWLDIDDGTTDGNLRVEPENGGAAFANEDADEDDGIGDTSIDMSDFRRFRDWLLQIENPAGLDLDGGSQHPKKDINGNQVIELPDEENVYPRGDFNGDGVLSRDATSRVPGEGAGSDLTDLQVLQLLFNDPDVDASELPDLIDSADIRVSPFLCLLQADKVVSSVSISGVGLVVGEFTHDEENIEHVFTVPVEHSSYTVRIDALDETGELLFTEESDFDVELGADYFWEPQQCNGVAIEMTMAEQIDAGTASPLLIRAGLVQGGDDIEYLEGISLEFEIAGGTVAETSGLTDADGFFNTEVTPIEDFDSMTVFVTATAPNGAIGIESRVAFPLVGVRLFENRSRIQAFSDANSRFNGEDNKEDLIVAESLSEFDASLSLNSDVSSEDFGPAKASVEVNSSSSVTTIAGNLTGGQGSATCQANVLGAIERLTTSATRCSASFVIAFEIGENAPPQELHLLASLDGSVDSPVSFNSLTVGVSGIGVSSDSTFGASSTFGANPLQASTQIDETIILEPGFNYSLSISGGMGLGTSGTTAQQNDGQFSWDFSFTLDDADLP